MALGPREVELDRRWEDEAGSGFEERSGSSVTLTSGAYPTGPYTLLPLAWPHHPQEEQRGQPSGKTPVKRMRSIQRTQDNKKILTQ